jgi:hypothetical protein
MKVTVDTTGLNTVLKLAQEYTSRTPAIAANTAAFFVARDIARNTPKVIPYQIISELNVQMIPRVGGRKPYPRGKNRLLGSADGGHSRKEGVPLGVLIVMASRKPGSNYNVSTNQRHFRKSSGNFREWMRQSVSRMIKARMKATAFLASSVLPSIRQLERVVEARYRRGAVAMDSTANRASKGSKTDKSYVVAAQEGSKVATCELVLNVGGEGKNSAAMNRAMHAKMGPVAQEAVNREALRAMEYIAMKRAEEMEKHGKASGVFA